MAARTTSPLASRPEGPTSPLKTLKNAESELAAAREAASRAEAEVKARVKAVEEAKLKAVTDRVAMLSLGSLALEAGLGESAEAVAKALAALAREASARSLLPPLR